MRLVPALLIVIAASAACVEAQAQSSEWESRDNLMLEQGNAPFRIRSNDLRRPTLDELRDNATDEDYRTIRIKTRVARLHIDGCRRRNSRRASNRPSVTRLMRRPKPSRAREASTDGRLPVRLITLVVVAGFAAAAQCAAAQTLYKLIDKDGKVTYSEAKPKEFDGQVIPLNIDPNANTATLPKFTDTKRKPGTELGGPAANQGNKSPAVDPVKAAQDRLDKAKAALQQAKDNPAEGDQLMVGKVGGGVRMIPSEDYQKKIEQLEQGVRDAEDNLTLAQKGG
jgi:Domain of unknown function (DUF4124)